MTVVSDTGPLIALAKVDRLSLLEQLFEHVFIPPIVHRELLAKSGPESARLDNALSGFVEVTQVSSLAPEVESATRRLDPGERQAVALSYLHNTLLLIDDRLGRDAARRLDLAITGTIGVLFRAKEAELIPAVCPLLEEMRTSGYWLSDDILEVAASLSGED